MKHLPALLFTSALLTLDGFLFKWVLFADSPNDDPLARIAIGVLMTLFTALAVASLVHALAAAAKGSLNVRFTDRPYIWDEEVAGSVDLLLHRRLVVDRLTVTLLAQHLVSRGGDKSDHWQTVIQIEQDLLAGGETLLPGKHAYPFQVRIPAKPSEANDATGSALLEGLGKTLLPFIQLAASSGFDGTLRWKMQAQLHTAGADLSDERLLRFNRAQF
jgi:hypothetical protein